VLADRTKGEALGALTTIATIAFSDPEIRLCYMSNVYRLPVVNAALDV
jgi:hypothetical protein